MCDPHEDVYIENDGQTECPLESFKSSFPVAGTIIEAKNLPNSSPAKVVIFNDLPIKENFLHESILTSLNVSMIDEKVSVNSVPDL